MVWTRLPVELVSLTRCRLQCLSTVSRQLTTSIKPCSNGPRDYITTPIFYVNAEPHIGHLHSMLLADVYKRFWHLQSGSTNEPVLCTGTDEHGMKIQRVAETKGITAKALCDAVSPRFKDLADAASIDYDIFIRTTEDRHRVAVQHAWRELNRRGFIYKSSYAGWYAVSDEAYYTPAQLTEVTDSATGEKYMASIESGSKVEWMEEENYKFRLSAFKDKLIEWLSSQPHPLQPPSRAQALLASLNADNSGDLADLSISRPSARLQWGIPVPEDPDHTIYVWIDALVNYMTAAGYPWQGDQGPEHLWPPRLQIVGKDIVRFHALYLPAILMALELPLPRNLLAHGHWTMDKFKMSKSRGNVANPFEAINLWGVETMRVYLMKAGGNSAVDAGQLGNLLSRISNDKLIGKLESIQQLVTLPNQIETQDEKLVEMLKSLPGKSNQTLLFFTIVHY
ncbi:methionyl-tRNA synthetase [Microbotryomycetes sp. JL221]|nr:methionyl-tRNA synthetase [Microbotryomycetes sp. JL221]